MAVPTSSSLPSLESLRCFVAAAESLNFRAAARAVALTPAALGQRIRQLEDELGATLFTRTTRQVSLTPAGMALLPHARALLAQAVDCGRAARGELGPSPVELVLGTRHELGMSWVLPLLDHLATALPWVTVHLYFGAGEDLLLRVRTREIDLAVTSTRFSDPRLDAIPLHEEEYVFVAARSLLDATPFSRADHAQRHTLLDAAPELPLFRYRREAAGGGDRLRFARVTRLGTIAAIEHFVRKGRGVAVLPRYLVGRRLTRGELVEILPSVKPLSDRFRLAFRADDARRPVYESLAAAMLERPLT